ncbi:UNVERIFIED_CONTAM: hypothetical protein GTU68_032436 [Idotea baltica]|nr:hypothetical protein [Idotea baltica]
MLKEFKNFIMTGNVIDFAVAVILAGAVGLVVNGFVADIIMPIVGHFAGGIDFAQMKVILTENAVRWGAWVNTIVNLLIVGFVMFLIVKAYNKSKAPVEEAPAAPAGPTAEELLAEIRDALKK